MGKSDRHDFAAAAVLVIVLTAVDQLTKWRAFRMLPGKPMVLVPGVLELRYLENHGAAFGILQNRQWLFIAATVLFLAGMFVFFLKVKAHPRLRMLLAVLAGGACGNLIDRIRFGFVRDFIYFKPIDFPVFNAADIFVTVSAALIILYILFFMNENDLTFSRKDGA